MSARERTTSVGPSDTKREHGSGTGHHHVLVAPAGPKRRLLHAQGMEQHGLTRGSSQISDFPLLGSGNTWWLESQGQSMWKTLQDMQSHLPSHLPPQQLWPICVSQQSQNMNSPSCPHPCRAVYSFARAWLAQAKAKAAPCTLPARPLQHPARRQSTRQHCRQHCRQQSTQEPVTWQRAPACSMQPVQPRGLPPTPAPPGKRLSCIQRLLDGGQQLPAPFQAVQTPGQWSSAINISPCETRSRSRDGVRGRKRCPPAGLRASEPAQPSPAARSPPMSWLSWFMARAPACRAQRWLAQRCADHVGRHRWHFCHQHREWQMPAPRIPQLPPILLCKHDTPKPTLNSTASALHETPTPT
ncbi:uncharacterized protein LOC120504339 [Passer montanus]|uniref:uncharacterized protein LOC120504339 n=1 Tax=Passer montanus TaxID=9160 RepID=UPI00195FE779|nr:uncharacterized protein LOC120504339 [Passer montanus]